LGAWQAHVEAARAQEEEVEVPPELATVEHVPIASVGWYDLFVGGKDTYISAEDLAAAADAVSDPHIKAPRIKLGHESDWGDAEPNFGFLKNMEYDADEATLYADIAEIPQWLVDFLPVAYPARSIEGSRNVKTNAERKHKFVLTALSMLGVVLPGVSNLEDLSEYYGAEAPKGVIINVTEQEEALPVKAKKVKAAVEMDDIRRAFWANFGNKPGEYWWLRTITLEPDAAIAQDEESGQLYKIPFAVSGQEISFEDPVPVYIEYVDDQPVAAATMVFASAAESRPPDQEAQMGNEKEKEEVKAAPNRDQLRQFLGLPEDADDEALDEALEATKTNEDPPPDGKVPKHAPPSGDNPDLNNPPGEKEEPTPAQQGLEERDDVSAMAKKLAAAGLAVVDQATLVQLKAGATVALRREEQDTKVRHDRLVTDAIKAGKIPPVVKDHYVGLMAKDEEGTTALLAAMPEGLLPVDERGTAQDKDDDQIAAGQSGAGRMYPASMLSGAERARLMPAKG
jgi:hypothetical protein